MTLAEPPVGIDVRQARASDAEALLALKIALDHESTMMMYEPGERAADPRAIENEILSRIEASNSTIIVAGHGDRLIGYVDAAGGEFRRNRHTALVTVGVRASHVGRGIGSSLFQALTEWSDMVGMIRLELTVMVHNTPARQLYERFGFLPEGVRTCSVRVDGQCVDEIAMARVRTDFARAGMNG